MTEREPGTGPFSSICHLKIPLLRKFSSLGEVSEAFPDVRFLMLSYLPLCDDEFTMNVRAENVEDAEGLLRRWRASDLLTSLELLGQTPHSLLVTITQKMPERSLMRTVMKHQILPMFPIQVRSGVLTGLVVTTPEKIRHFLIDMSKVSPGTTLESIRPGDLLNIESLFTPRQREVYQAARTAGYWDIPRRTTVTALAQTMHLSKSSLAETLAMIEKKLVQEAEHHSPEAS